MLKYSKITVWNVIDVYSHSYSCSLLYIGKNWGGLCHKFPPFHWPCIISMFFPEILYANNFGITYLSDPTTANFFVWSITANIFSEFSTGNNIQSLSFVQHTKCLYIPHGPITMFVVPTVTTSATFWRFIILATIHSNLSIFQSAPMIFDFLYLFSFYFDIFCRVCLNVFNFIL